MGKGSTSGKRQRGTPPDSAETARAEVEEDSTEGQDELEDQLVIDSSSDDVTRQLGALLGTADYKKMLALLKAGALNSTFDAIEKQDKQLSKVLYKQLYPLLGAEARYEFDAACNNPLGYPDWSTADWTRLIESVDPNSDKKPSLDAYPHHAKINGRGRMVPADVARRFKMPSNLKYATIDAEFKTLQDKQVKPLLRLAMHGLEHSAVDLSTVPKREVRDHAAQSADLLKLQSQYILFLNADVVRRRKQAAFMALGMTDKEATGEDLNPSTSLFDDKDFGRMQDTVKLRKEIRELGSKLSDKTFKKKKKKVPSGGFGRRQQQQDADTTEKPDASQSQEKKSTPSQKGSASTTPIKKKKGGGKGQ